MNYVLTAPRPMSIYCRPHQVARIRCGQVSQTPAQDSVLCVDPARPLLVKSLHFYSIGVTSAKGRARLTTVIGHPWVMRYYDVSVHVLSVSRIPLIRIPSSKHSGVK